MRLSSKLSLLLLLVASSVFGQALIYTSNATLAWDAVTDLDTGDPIDVVDVVEYELARSADPVTDRANPETILGTTQALTYSITLPQDQNWYVYAIRSVLITDSGQTILYSSWNWSDQNGAETPSPFFYRHPALVPPSVPLGFRGQ